MELCHEERYNAKYPDFPGFFPGQRKVDRKKHRNPDKIFHELAAPMQCSVLSGNGQVSEADVMPGQQDISSFFSGDCEKFSYSAKIPSVDSAETSNNEKSLDSVQEMASFPVDAG